MGTIHPGEVFMALSVSSVSAASGSGYLGSPVLTGHDGRAREKFAAAMDAQRALQTDLHTELAGIQQKVLQGHQFSAKELLYYQIRAGQFNLRVELCSKLADSLLSVTRRLQNQQ